MNSRNYKRQIAVKATPKAAYNALTTGYAHWWTSPDKPLTAIGDISKFSFSGRHGYWSFKATALSPTRIEMVCVEALHIHEGMPKEIETEWLGSKLIWEIEEVGENTIVSLEHEGLTPDLHCYEICESGWDMFFVDSLKSYLDTGRGHPFRDQ